jgi:putative transposase
MRASLDPFRFLILAVAGWINQRQRDAIDFLVEENRVLREQIGDRRLRFTDDQRRRLAAKAKVVGRKCLSEIATLVTPETLLSWHRKLIAQKYDGSSKREPGRPRILANAEALILRMARENRDWGYRRLQGALRNLGYDYAKSTVANILKKHGVEPAPERSRKTTWKEFLNRHWEQLVATDFFTIEVWTPKGLQRFVVLFFLELSTRRVEVAGIASMPNGLWMTQIARNLTDGVDGFFTGKRYLIHDRDPLYTNEFMDMLADVRVQSVKLPRRSPNLNAYAERFVRTIKESCLDRMIWFGEDALRRGISEFVSHYHFERNHQGLDNRLIIPKQTTAATAGMVQKRERLGGMLNYYFREAA